MKKVFMAVLAVMMGFALSAQTDTSSDPARTDTIRVGSIIIVKNPDSINKSYEVYDNKVTDRFRRRRDRISTNWMILDIGFANYDDRTNYSSAEAQNFVRNSGNPPANEGDFEIKTRSSNINLWFFMQRMSLVRNIVNLKYGFGIEMNNYYYKSNIRYYDDPTTIPTVYVLREPVNFSKNKLAADYFTVPFMINFNTSPRSYNGGIDISFGVSAGYLYSSRNKQKSDERGKQKFKSDFNLERWKFAYVGELGLGPVKLYGSYSFTALHKYGIEQYPYAVGLRLSSWK